MAADVSFDLVARDLCHFRSSCTELKQGHLPKLVDDILETAFH